MALSQPQLPQNQNEVGMWLDSTDVGIVLKAIEENPILKEQVEFYKKQKDLDEQEKIILNSRITLEQERTALEQEKTKFAEDKALASQTAYNEQKKVSEEYKNVIKQQEKDITKAKLFGTGGILTGIVVAVLSLIIIF